MRAIHGPSILNAIGATGLQLYNFGQTVSMVFFTETWKPDSFYDRIKENAHFGFHTLILVDIKVKEPNLESMARGKIVYEPPRYMTVAQCAEQMLEIEKARKEGICADDHLAVGAARVGSEQQRMVCGTLNELKQVDLGPPLHSLVLLGRRTHELEREYIRDWAVNKDTFDKSWEKYYGRQS
jgi:diphthine methyl ester synthase